jgi:hypothetical protein
MAQSTYLKHLRVLFTLLCSLSLLSYGGWLAYTQFVQQQITEPMLAQAQRAQVDFETMLLSDPTGAGTTNEANAGDTSGIAQSDEDKLASLSQDVPVSTLTAMELLNVKEVINTALNAVKFDQLQELTVLQARLIDTAMQLNIAPQQIDFLRSAQAYDFMMFRAKRAWFNEEVQKRYYQLRSLDGLLEAFPEARGELYQDATTLIIDRDLIIFNMAKILANEQERLVTEQDIADAQAQWQASLAKLN